MRCPSCDRDVPGGSRFCPSCGRTLTDPGAPTIDAPSRTEPKATTPWRAAPTAARGSTPPSHLSSSSIHGSFAPGQALAGRYRVVSLLGRGGMGEVYRADDLTLGVPVALKFLPPALMADAARLERLRAEVRTTRQISHPNVCRVYDIGEAEGRLFIAMEYVDGEDLASLLRRIGRLPEDKALEIARQVCAGLAAAHDLGIVHRDLKPANIMLDGRGRARLMDFGVAGEAADLAARGDITAGTPVYMAPEQLAGRGVSARSDIYSLGLVLYELFTGRSAWAASAHSIEELRRLHASSRPDRPASIVADMDPLVERVIERCLELDPENRPASALAVSAALPGGDPLAAALAAGETPSPEMVAQAGRVGAMPVRKAVVLLAAAAAALAALILVRAETGILAYARPEIPGEVLHAKAREMLGSLGYDEKHASEADGFAVPDGYLEALRRSALQRGDVGWTRALADPWSPTLVFFFRRSQEAPTFTFGETFTTWDKPPQTSEGSARVMLDSRGRLIAFDAVPPRKFEPPAGEPVEFDWPALFTKSGLDIRDFAPVDPEWTPLVACDARRAWAGDLPTEPPTPIRVEAASERGRPVWFRIVYPWSRPERLAEASGTSAGVTVVKAVWFGLIVAMILGGAVLAWRNIRAGKHDRRGSAFAALFILIANWLGLWLMADSLRGMFVRSALWTLGATALFDAMLAWLFYAALEPVVRRLWPNVLITWTRLLAGRARDPQVGGDVLTGVAAGLALAVLENGGRLLPAWLGAVPAAPNAGWIDALRGGRATAGILCLMAGSTVVIGMVLTMLLILARFVCRRNRPAIVVFTLTMALLQWAAFELEPTTLPLAAAIAVLLALVLVRLGMLAFVVMLFAGNALGALQPTADPSSWYVGQTIAMIAVAGALALYGFFTALGGQKLVSADPFAPR